MNYLGAKQLLLSFITESIAKYVDVSDKVIVDLFAGTGAIGKYYKGKTKLVIANDLEYYSYVLNRNYIQNNFRVTEYHNDLLMELNYISPVKGFIYEEYAVQRKYFTKDNASRIDAIRIKIEELKSSISEDEYYWLLCCLLESADRIANNTGTYSSYLKEYEWHSKRPLQITDYSFGEGKGMVYNMDANDLIKQLNYDILYLDPPYNERQYSACYHVLNGIAKYDSPVLHGVSGYPKNYNKSLYCRKNEAKVVFEDLIKNANFSFIFVSYNNEGILTPDLIKEIMEKYGKYSLETQEYERYRKTGNNSKTTEFLHVLQKSSQS